MTVHSAGGREESAMAAAAKQCGHALRMIAQDQDRMIYRMEDETGHAVMTVYTVFPGITLIYHDVHMQQYSAAQFLQDGVLEIDHCREGRMECETQDAFFYLTSGDMAVSQKTSSGHEVYFPLRHYHGISIAIDSRRAPDCLSCFLEDVNVRPAALTEKFCSRPQCFVLRAKPCLEHIFSELYSVPESIRKGYLKVKVLELLLFLSGMDLPDGGEKSPSYSQGQVRLAKEVCQFISAHLESHLTIDQLSGEFHVSATKLKNCFRGVYGVSVYAYIRSQKMEAAGRMIRQTDRKILEIAGRYGYDNGSKFAKAFQDTMGMTPSQYRSAPEEQLRWLREEEA